MKKFLIFFAVLFVILSFSSCDDKVSDIEDDVENVISDQELSEMIAGGWREADYPNDLHYFNISALNSETKEGKIGYSFHDFTYTIKGDKFILKTFSWGSYYTFDIPFKYDVVKDTLTLKFDDEAGFDTTGTVLFIRRKS